MSTRGAIALPAGDGWWGRYHHFDSYPTALGRELFRLYHATFGRDHRDMATVLLQQHPAGWSSIIAASNAEGPYTRTDFEQSGYTTDDHLTWRYPVCYCHGSRAEPESWLVCRCPTDATDCSPLWIEWAYVLTPHGMSVLTAHHPNPARPPAHRLITHLTWENSEPDWHLIENHAHHTTPHHTGPETDVSLHPCATAPRFDPPGPDPTRPAGNTRVRTHRVRRAYASAPAPRGERTHQPLSATTRKETRAAMPQRPTHTDQHCTAANRHARFHPMTGAESLPCLELAGILVFAYLDEQGRLCVTLDLDSAEDRLRHGAEETVPVQVRIGDTLVADSATGLPHSGGLTIDQRTLEEWAGRPLSHTDLTRLHQALEHSTVPEAIATILFSFVEGTDAEDVDEGLEEETLR